MAIHPTAIVDTQAEIADTAEIGPFAVIEGQVKIGEGVKVYPNAYISGWTEIGDHCQIHPGAVVGHLPQDFHFNGDRSYCKIGAGTIIREFASVHRGALPESWTILGENCFILGYAHIGHDCKLGNGVKVYNCAGLSGHVVVGDSAIVSGYTLVHQFARIGEYVMIGGGSRVTKDVPPYMKALYESTCIGYNALGLRRSEAFTQDEIADVKEAYRILFRSGLPLGKAVVQFTSQARTRAGRRIIEFINSESKLGIIGGRKAAANHRFAAVGGDCAAADD
ncbi:MAG: acyl-ACP--UDP-N-acetylglucosamine O-acyltransferase [Phycisphaerae bacterium]|nr:acyl-ACP--UDP-N-acetylglucosamine O-acyltransferase [Phycisphaerae bacterium]